MQQDNVQGVKVELEDSDFEDDNLKVNGAGLSLIKSLQEFMDQKHIQLITDIMNLTLSVCLFLIYVARTYTMCKFDDNPIWRMPATSLEPQFGGDMYPKDSKHFDLELKTHNFNANMLSEHYFPSEQCTGEFHFYYYSLLAFAHSYFLTEYVLRALIQKEILLYLQESDSIIEIVTTVPFFLLWFIFGKEDYYFQLFLSFDTMRLFLYDRYIKNIKSELTKESTKIILFMFNLIMFSSIVIEFIENQYRYQTGTEGPHVTNGDGVVEEYDMMLSFAFFDSFYFMMTTISVVGYGSSIASLQGKLALIIIILFIIITIPEKASELVTLNNSKSKYARAQYDHVETVPHIVLIGTFSMNSLMNFLREYFHPDHGDSLKHCVLLIPDTPDPQLEIWLSKEAFDKEVTILEGISSNDEDLDRCLINQAEAVIILSDKFSFNAEQEDTKTILEAMIIKKYLANVKKKQQYAQMQKEQTENGCDTRMCMQLLRPDSYTHYELSLTPEEIKTDRVICIESLKLSLLSKSCVCPGLVVLVNNLIKSSEDPPDDVEDNKDDPNYQWLNEYWTGKQYEIYKVEIPQSYQGRRFCEIANTVYKEHGLLLFALEIVINDKENGEILMNPGNYKLPQPCNTKEFKYKYTGYLLAGDEKDANGVFSKDDNNIDEAALNNGSIDSNENEILAENEQKYGEMGEADDIDIENIDGEWLNICQTSTKPIYKEDITFETMQDTMLAENHIIVCGMVENIKYFVMPLRAGYNKDPSPIVILHDELPTAKQWAELNTFPQIYFVQGSPLQEKSYDRVNIMKAKQVVILTPNVGKAKKKKQQKTEDEEDEKPDPADEENLLDAQTIFKYNIIKRKNKNVNVVTELVNQDNIAYLLDNPLLYNLLHEYKYDQTPVFASGEVYLSSLMDALICQTYFNPALSIVLKQLIIGDVKKNNSKKKRKNNFDTDFSHVQISNLYHIAVPKEFIDRKYSKLFDSLTTRRYIIPIGLYRQVRVNLNAYKESYKMRKYKGKGALDGMTPESDSFDERDFNSFKYVVTNPDKGTKLRKDDRIFVLAKNDPGNPDNWDDYTHQNKDMFDPKQIKIMGNISNMMHTNQMKDAKKGDKSQGNNGQKKASQNKIGMANQESGGLNQEDEDRADLKQDIHQSLSSKKIQDEFDQELSNLNETIGNMTDRVINLQKKLNKRNNNIVGEVSKIIHHVLHETENVQEDADILKKGLSQKSE